MSARFHALSVGEFAELVARFPFTRRIETVHLHHTWKPTHADYDGLRTIEAMWRYHTQTNGWSDIAQHVTVAPDGTIWTGRPWNQPPCSAAGHNGNRFAGPFMIEMIGDFDGRDPPGRPAARRDTRGDRPRAASQWTAASGPAFSQRDVAEDMSWRTSGQARHSCPGRGKARRDRGGRGNARPRGSASVRRQRARLPRGARRPPAARAANAGRPGNGRALRRPVCGRPSPAARSSRSSSARSTNGRQTAAAAARPKTSS